MKKSRFTNEQIAFALRQVETGVSVEEVCRKIDVSQQTFYRWKKKFAGMGVAELRRLKSGSTIIYVRGVDLTDEFEFGFV